MTTAIRYVRRVEMTLDLTNHELPEPTLPDGFFWTAWNPVLISTHARILHAAFCNDLDGRVFPTYRQYEACEYLVRASSSAKSFAPEGTWLIGREIEVDAGTNVSVGRPLKFCAAIQGVRPSKKMGQIQNVSTLPTYRRQGLGRALVLKALNGFLSKGRTHASLEVTAENTGAIRLYSSLGFQPKKLYFSESFIETGPFDDYETGPSVGEDGVFNV
ncbi:MAG: GNAT family N-acetyltransferase [Thermoguttaceae bacterium]|nr:GNAT family N-acetyltransferase [Thermoguttaceae bacterium]